MSVVVFDDMSRADSTVCGNGEWGTHLWTAKWVGTLTKEVVRTFVDSIYGPAQYAMFSMQVTQTEQASIQAVFSLVSSLSGMWAPEFFTEHVFDVNATGFRVIRYAFLGYASTNALLSACRHFNRLERSSTELRVSNALVERLGCWGRVCTLWV